MAVLGKVARAGRYGALHERHVYVEDLTGPAADVSIAAAGTATVSFNVAQESPRDIQYAGVESVTGLPANVYIAGISFDKTNKTLTITLYNADTANAATVAAGSLTVRVVTVS